ncbi:helix-turn-helix domain-containing protein [Cohnella sp. GCM10027633]|uniref:response regulator transcription factor n=1 Tax=unclassified Cohnella TaxID=2636738 RepID=UPI00362BEB44
MWKVVIVEDEAFVRDSIKQMIPWAKLGFALAGEAGNGEDGLALVEEVRPDVVITDIMMPKMDGVMMLKAAREGGSEARFIMLTCMNEFEYARLALEYGASSYILKLSMTIEALQDALGKATKELSAKTARSAEREREMYEAIYDKLWREFRTSAFANDRAEDSRQKPLLPYVSIFCAFDGELEPTGEAGLPAGIAASPGEHAVAHAYRSDGLTTYFVWSNAQGTTMPSGGSEASPLSYVYRLDVPGDRLAHEWFGALRHMDAIWYGRERGPIRVADSALVEPEARMPEGRKSNWGEWLACFEHVKTADGLRLLAQEWADMERRSLPMPLVKDHASQLVRLLEQYVRMTPELYVSVTTAASHLQLLARMERIVSVAMDDIVKDRSAYTDHSEINKVIGYIHTHYDNNITLRSMASFVSLDESYLSSLFKKKTGVSLIHYVQQVRIDRAKQLLAEGKSVNQAAELVGFVDDSYFIKIFRRFENRSPAEFKRHLADR